MCMSYLCNPSADILETRQYCMLGLWAACYKAALDVYMVDASQAYGALKIMQFAT